MVVTPRGFEPRLDDGDDQSGDAYWFVVQQGKLLVMRGGETPYLPNAALPVDRSAGVIQCFGEYDGLPCRVLVLEPDTLPENPDAGYEWRGLRSLFGVLPDAEVGIASRAMQLAEWARTHRHCGCCGTPMQRQPGERAMLCPACGFSAYPRIAPAMMVLVKRDDRILLGRSSRFVKGVYSALAGFVEAGESLEECVHREVREEVDIEVTNLRYFRSQSWPFPHSLMLAFVADYAGGELRPNPDELVDARWFGLDELPPLPGQFSISRSLIEWVVDDLRSKRRA